MTLKRSLQKAFFLGSDCHAFREAAPRASPAARCLGPRFGDHGEAPSTRESTCPLMVSDDVDPCAAPRSHDHIVLVSLLALTIGQGFGLRDL